MMTTEAQHFQALEKENHKNISNHNVITNSKQLWTNQLFELWDRWKIIQATLDNKLGIFKA